MIDCSNPDLVSPQVVAMIMGGSQDEKIKLLFTAFDDDGNGTLSHKEFLNATKKFASHLSKADAEALVKKVRIEKVFG